MGRGSAKHYVYHQTFHEHPIVEGLTARTPAAAFDYIKNTMLLSRWRRSRPLRCDPYSAALIRKSLDSLREDGFHYIIAHHKRGGVELRFADYFRLPPVYRDRLLSVYSVEDMQARSPCGEG
jgi:hypothetical protein